MGLSLNLGEKLGNPKGVRGANRSGARISSGSVGKASLGKGAKVHPGKMEGLIGGLH